MAKEGWQSFAFRARFIQAFINRGFYKVQMMTTFLRIPDKIMLVYNLPWMSDIYLNCKELVCMRLSYDAIYMTVSNAGKRRYDRKQAGFGGQTKPVFHKKVMFIYPKWNI
jgi:hypothetical protein